MDERSDNYTRDGDGAGGYDYSGDDLGGGDSSVAGGAAAARDNGAGVQSATGRDQSGTGSGENSSGGSGQNQSNGSPGTRNRGGRPRKTEGQSAAKVVLVEDQPEKRPTKIPADLLDFARTVVWALGTGLAMMAPVIDHPEIPPMYLKQLWSLSGDEIETLAQPVGGLLLKLPAKTRKKLETISPVAGLVTALASVIGPRLQVTQEVMARAKAPLPPKPINTAGISHDDFVP